MVHHNFKKGQRIYCILRDNSVIVAKYLKSTGHYLELENHKIPWVTLEVVLFIKINLKLLTFIKIYDIIYS